MKHSIQRKIHIFNCLQFSCSTQFLKPNQSCSEHLRSEPADERPVCVCDSFKWKTFLHIFSFPKNEAIWCLPSQVKIKTFEKQVCFVKPPLEKPVSHTILLFLSWLLFLLSFLLLYVGRQWKMDWGGVVQPYPWQTQMEF